MTREPVIGAVLERPGQTIEVFSSREARRLSRSRSWKLIGFLLATAIVAGLTAGFSFVWSSWLATIAIVGVFMGLAWIYEVVRKVDDGRISETFHETALLIAYGPPAAAISYIVIAPGLPLMDARFAAMDLALGFDWPTYYRWVTERPVVDSILKMFYMSSLPHIAVMLIATGLSGRTCRTRELNMLLIATSLPIVLISGITPAVSAWVHHGYGEENAYHLTHFLGLRDGSFRRLEVGELLGIITFPSFHTSISMVLIWVSRGIPWLFWPTLVVGMGQLVSIPAIGGHYLVDMIAAAILGVITIASLQRKWRD